jgi:tetratricopeptide (TPR) repeat protein
MRVAFPSFALAILLATSGAARDSKLDDNSLAGRNEYERCLSLIKRNAREAADSAEMWHTLGGGAPALHCEALALVSLRRYADAGVKLDQAALSESPAQKNFRIALFDQAGNAWLLAGDAQKAEASINSALALAPKDEDILFDRARARAARKNWSGAEADLSALLSLDANRADALVLRASARHAEGHKPQADADIARALQVYPDYPEALVERGAMKYEAGDAAGAKADWELAARDAPNGDAGAAARQHLADMNAAAAKPTGK